MAEDLLDARGCLTAAGLRVLREAVPGAAPPEVAAHLASCARCQGRLLASGREATQAADAERLRGWRRFAYVLLGASLLAGVVLVVLVLLRR